MRKILLSLLIFLSILSLACLKQEGKKEAAAQEEAGSQEKDEYALMRERMVSNQIARRGVSDKLVLSAMRKVPRHLFVPEELLFSIEMKFGDELDNKGGISQELRQEFEDNGHILSQNVSISVTKQGAVWFVTDKDSGKRYFVEKTGDKLGIYPEKMRRFAYEDRPLPIGEEQTISQPYIVALMTELLGLKGGEKVLEIGTGSGYQAAVLAEIAKEVYTIEIIESLANTAEERLQKMGYKNITVKWGDGYQGWEEHAPFDGVIVTAAPDHIPQPLVDQLKIGGRMVIPVGDYFQELKLLTKTEEGVKEKNVIPVRFVPMTGEAQEKEDE
jgi:protein-L-isoaspartate(D-aspartate) O-methyltransferase